jgi:serine/threonine protein phosphatase PrpC
MAGLTGRQRSLQSRLQIEVGQFSHPGRRRPNNEDWLGTFQPDDAKRLARKGRLFLVADGMGGHRSGELASRQAVDQVIRGYLDEPAPDVGTSLRRAIEAANAGLYARVAKAEGTSRWGTTMVAAVVQGAELWVANVGDSRAYLWREGQLRQLTRDHALFPATEGSGPDAERPGRHIITRALGTRPNVEVDLFPSQKLRVGDRILLCSDGLTTPLSEGEIAAVLALHPAQACAEALVRAANERGGPDNVSVILLDVVRREATTGWREIGQALAGAVRLESWPGLLQGLLQLVPGAEQGPRSSVFWVTVVLLVLALFGLGFMLGLVLLH